MATLVRVFTHPACPGCPAAVKWAWRLQEVNPHEFRLLTVSLETKEGLNEAHAEGVKTIPTIILSKNGEELERIIGSPKPEDYQRCLNLEGASEAMEKP